MTSISRVEALGLLHREVKEDRLKKHMLAVEVIMRGLGELLRRFTRLA